MRRPLRKAAGSGILTATIAFCAVLALGGSGQASAGREPVLAISSDGSKPEGDAGLRRFTFALDIETEFVVPRTQTPEVHFRTVDGTAKAGQDYVPKSGVVRFLPGEDRKKIVVSLVGDTEREPDENFYLELFGEKNLTISYHPSIGKRWTAIIVNDDGEGPPAEQPSETPPYLTFRDRSIREPESAQTVCLDAGLSGPATRAVAFDWEIVESSQPKWRPQRGKDFSAPAYSGRATIPAGEQDGRVVCVTILPDDDPERDESFLVALRNVKNATFDAVGAEVTILDDDRLPLVMISDAERREGDSGGTAFVFAVSLERWTRRPVKVTYRTTSLNVSDAATAVKDYVPLRGVVTFKPGKTYGQIRVTVIGDRLAEPNERFFVELSDAENAAIPSHGRDLATGTILNDDGPPPP